MVDGRVVHVELPVLRRVLRDPLREAAPPEASGLELVEGHCQQGVPIAPRARWPAEKLHGPPTPFQCCAECADDRSVLLTVQALRQEGMDTTGTRLFALSTACVTALAWGETTSYMRRSMSAVNPVGSTTWAAT